MNQELITTAFFIIILWLLTMNIIIKTKDFISREILPIRRFLKLQKTGGVLKAITRQTVEVHRVTGGLNMCLGPKPRLCWYRVYC